MTGLDVDTATDIYSLGVVLYELLSARCPSIPRRCGRPATRRSPHHSRGRASPAHRQTARVGAVGDGGRQTPPHGRANRWIVFCAGHGLDRDEALDKDRTRRYASASEFAADITRHLQNEVVVARPPSLGYRTSRFVRKHRGRWPQSSECS